MKYSSHLEEIVLNMENAIWRLDWNDRNDIVEIYVALDNILVLAIRNRKEEPGY